jgi:hypothetical protein
MVINRNGLAPLIVPKLTTVPSRLVAWGLMRTAGHIWIGADCLQNTLAILPDKYASAECPQLWLLLMHGDAPATAVQCDRRGQPSEPRSGNLSMHRWTPYVEW